MLVHCAAGKDRTGIAIALVLRLLGVGHDEVLADYLLTNEARRRDRSAAQSHLRRVRDSRMRSTWSSPKRSPR